MENSGWPHRGYSSAVRASTARQSLQCRTRYAWRTECRTHASTNGKIFACSHSQGCYVNEYSGESTIAEIWNVKETQPPAPSVPPENGRKSLTIHSGEREKRYRNTHGPTKRHFLLPPDKCPRQRPSKASLNLSSGSHKQKSRLVIERTHSMEEV